MQAGLKPRPTGASPTATWTAQQLRNAFPNEDSPSYLTVADLIQPFYAEIRMGECPTKSWWWNGIPTTSPPALLIGKPYAELWPDLVSAARSSSTGLHYLDQFVETAPNDAGNRIPSPPSSIAQPPEPARQTVFDPSKPEDMAAMFQPHKTPYSEVWPFEGPVS